MPTSAAQGEEALLSLDLRDEQGRRVDEIESGKVQLLTHGEVFGQARAAISAPKR